MDFAHLPTYRHLKTGNLYQVLTRAIDATNARDGNTVVVYFRPESPGHFFVRDEGEFNEKFAFID